MVKWLRNIFRNWLFKDTKDVNNAVSTKADYRYYEGMTINVSSAIGGKIVSVTTQSNNNSLKNSIHTSSSQSNTTTYIIPDDANFDKRLVEIISLENFKS